MKHRIVVAVRTLASCLGFLFLGISYAGNDTPDELMSMAKVGSFAAIDLFTPVNEAINFLNRTSSDKAYATKLLDEIKKNNTTGVIAIVKETAPRSTVTVQRINVNLSLTLVFTYQGHKIITCVASDRTCNGSNASVGTI